MEVSFLDLKEKEIVNVYDGRKLGRIIDVIFDISSAQLLGIVAPGDKKIFRKVDDIFIPIDKIKRIGGDVILVGLQFETGYSKLQKKDNSQNLRSYENYYSNEVTYNQNNKNAKNNQKFRNSYQNQSNFENSYNQPINRNYSNNSSYIRYRPMQIRVKN